MDSAQEKTLDKVDLNVLIQSTYQQHSRHVFEILRADELGKYHPVYQYKKKAYSGLSQALRYSEYMNSVLEVYRKYEARRRTIKKADLGQKFLEALETLRGKTVAPLMAELPFETAYILWARAGSWTGALSMAGLDPLTDAQRAAAVERYALTNARPVWIPKDIRRKFSPELVSQLSLECEKARNIGVFPHQNSIPKQLVAQLREKGYTAHKIFWYMGITCRTSSEKSALMASKQNEIQTIRDGAIGWRRSEAYAAASRNEPQEPEEKKGETLNES
jgi:hypothetical protein